MTHFGVNRLVLLNSGNYLQANILLDQPVHLSASNNRGKSTLVNSLQFLYISDRSKMRFGKRTLDDSLKHYFGEQRSYIVYECQTPTGDQCMLIRGRGNLGGSKYDRYVYDGKYSEHDFIDENREILDFEAVCVRLADRQFTLVKGSELWRVLAANAPNSSGPSAARLGLLPIKRRDQYTAFCDVFVRLLSLQTTDARTLRQLVIESHASDIGERRIDIASEYSDEFAMAERSEHELSFMRNIIEQVDKGIELRQTKQEIIEQLAASMASVWQDAAVVRVLLSDRSVELLREIVSKRVECQAADAEERIALTLQGEQKAECKGLQKSWDAVQDLHERWNGYSEEFIAQMRLAADKVAQDASDLRRQLSQSAKLDISAMQRSVNQLKARIVTDKQYVEKSERTLIACLNRGGVTHAEIANLHRIAHPGILKSIVGESAIVHDSDALVSQAKAVAARISAEAYTDEAITIKLSLLNDSEMESLFDVASVRSTLKLNEQLLVDEDARLATAKDQQAARQRLSELEVESTAKSNELREYNSYVDQWAKRDVMKGELDAANQTLADTVSRVTRLDSQKRALTKVIIELGQRRQQFDDKLSVVNTAAVKFRETLTTSGIADELTALPIDQQNKSVDRDPDTLLRFADSTVSQLGKLTRRASELSEIDRQLSEVQSTIQAEARNAKTTPRYFNEPEEEWRQLTETRLAFDDLETAATKEWNHLFTTLGARMNAIVTAVRKIKTEVERIKRALKSYQVSNLAAVEISVEETHDTYSAIETLAEADSLFNNRDSIEIAKRRLRTMIDSAEVIELESLFEIKINIQDTSGTWRRAASLDEIGSTGTGMTVKAMIFIQLIRAIASDERYRLHFYIDGLGELDDANLSATAGLAVSRGILPITADPRLHLEPLAHPSVTVYSLGQYSNGKFYIDGTRSYQARRIASEPNGDSSDA